ncbi:hypothetical protein ACVWYQ_003206 [Bradyrhizobium sp. USDA 3397]
MFRFCLVGMSGLPLLTQSDATIAALVAAARELVCDRMNATLSVFDTSVGADGLLNEAVLITSSGSTLAEEVRYAPIIGPGLTQLLNDGRLELDPNPVENAIRPICMIRKQARSSPVTRSEPKTGLCSHPSCRPASSTTSTRSPTSPKHSKRSSPAIHQAKLTTSCHGESAKGQAGINRAAANLQLRTFDTSCERRAAGEISNRKNL